MVYKYEIKTLMVNWMIRSEIPIKLNTKQKPFQHICKD